VLDDLLDSARRGLSHTLVVRGEAGVGKTALIDYAIGRAGDFLVVRFTGIESESELGYAALHRLLTPVQHQIKRLPEPQREAMSSALGLAAGPPSNPFRVGLGTMSLAANAARAASRLLCVIDDSQWVDRESLAALAFWGRRIHAEGVALIFCDRDASKTARLLEGFDVLEVGGLDDESARELLGARSGALVEPNVAKRIVAETGGNALALVELATTLSDEQLAGATPLATPLPLARRLEEHFARQVRTLPADTQMYLLVAAADSSGRATLIHRAATMAGVPVEAAEQAEAHNLLTITPEVAFRHPLIRSAVYSAARPADRRAAHRALAMATGAEGDDERMAWHLGAAAVGADEDVAALLERNAARAGERGQHSARSSMLSRAAELSPDVERAAERRVAAADAALTAGSLRHVHALVAAARPHLTDVAVGARADRLEGYAWSLEGKVAIAAPALLAAARALAPVDPVLARQTLLEALEAALLAGDRAGQETGRDDDVTHAIAADVSASSAVGEATVEALLAGLATFVASGYVAALPDLRRAVVALESSSHGADHAMRWARLASSITRTLWDQDGHGRLMAALSRAASEQGALRHLGAALEGQAAGEMWAGDFVAAESLFDQASEVYAAAGFGQWTRSVVGLDLVAMRGRADQVRERAKVALAAADQFGMGSLIDIVDRAMVTLELGFGHYREALTHAIRVFDADPLALGNDVLADMVEAATRGGEPDVARAALDRLIERAGASGSTWAAGLVARARAITPGEDAAEPCYVDAIELLRDSRQQVELARTRLLFGEWLRRERRHADARPELRAAYDLFTTIGAEAFAGRAQAELLATGEHVRRRTVETASELTPQEAHVARLAADGATNGEIAAQLFISASTVEYHLRKVFRKLTITSRRQLRQALQS
jgi:DNA-binding CsgD family transcriptional regulator